MVCPNCGAIVADNLEVCPNCGGKLKDLDIGKTKIISEGSFGETKVFGVSYEKTVVLREEKEPILGWLVVLEGEPKWQDYRIPLKDSQILIGSSQEADIQLKGQGIEKVHASLRVREGKVYLTDLDTETGTRVNGEAITKVEIEDSNEIEIGNVRLKFRRL